MMTVPYCDDNCSVPTYRPKGPEDFVQDLQQSFLSTGGDVVLGQLQKRQAIFTLTPYMLGRKGEWERERETERERERER